MKDRKEKTERKSTETKYGWNLFIIAAGISLIVLGGLKQELRWLVGIGTIVLFLSFLGFTIVHEGTAQAVMTLGKRSKIIFQWEKHWMDTDWNIWKEGEKRVEGKERALVRGRIFGGLYVYFWPTQKIHCYKHRWSDIRLREDGKMDVEFHEEELSHVLLKPAVYAIKLYDVETKPPERIPVIVLILITARIRNPDLFLFVAPPTPLEDILARISAEMRATITSCFIDDLLRLRGESLWAEKKEESGREPLLKGAKIIEETLEKWGMELADKGIEIREIDLPPAYQKVGAARKAEELKAVGRAEEIMGTVISAVARAAGKEEKEVQTEFKRNPRAFCQKHQQIMNNTMTKLSMEEGAYLRIETPGAEGALGDFLRLLGAGKRMPMREDERKGEKPKKAKTLKEKREELRRKTEAYVKGEEEEEEE